MVTTWRSHALMLRMGARRKREIDAVAPVLERVNTARTRRIEREGIFSLDKSVGSESRMPGRWVVFRLSHLGHQRSSSFGGGRVKPRFLQGCDRRTPLFLYSLLVAV